MDMVIGSDVHNVCTDKSTKRMVDRYGQERPIMHACGHDLNMAALLEASELSKTAKTVQWHTHRTLPTR